MPSALGPKPSRHHILPSYFERVARATLDLPQAGADLRLGGANALSEFYLGHRSSLHLDFFAMNPATVDDVARALPAGMTARGVASEVATEFTSAGFHRFIVRGSAERGPAEVRVDIGRWSPPVISLPVVVDGMRVESWAELAVGKLLALVDRDEAKDVLDFWAICRDRDELPVLLAYLAEKDPGLGEAKQWIASRFSQLGERLPAQMPPTVEPVDLDETRRWYAEAGRRLWREIRPRENER